MSFSVNISGHLEGEEAGPREQRIHQLAEEFASMIRTIVEEAPGSSVTGSWAGQFTAYHDLFPSPTASAGADEAATPDAQPGHPSTG